MRILIILKLKKRLCFNLLFPFASLTVANFLLTVVDLITYLHRIQPFCWLTPLPPSCVALPRSVKLYLLHLSQLVYLAQVSVIFKEFPNLCADFFRCCLRLLAHWENGEWDGVSLVLLTFGRDKSVTES